MACVTVHRLSPDAFTWRVWVVHATPPSCVSIATGTETCPGAALRRANAMAEASGIDVRGYLISIRGAVARRSPLRDMWRMVGATNG